MLDFENNLMLQVRLHGHVLSIVGGLPGQYYSTPEGYRKGGGRSLDDYTTVEIGIFVDGPGGRFVMPSTARPELFEFDHYFGSDDDVASQVPVEDAKRLLAAFVLIGVGVSA